LKKYKYILRLAGITTCLIGALMMAFGEPILGATHTGIATVVGILGLGIITASNKTPFSGNNKRGK
jgi:hypothetical protein